MFKKFLALIASMMLLCTSVALGDGHYAFAVKDFDRAQDLVDFLNENNVEIIQIETFQKRYDLVQRLWYQNLEEEYPDDPEYPDYPYLYEYGLKK